MTETAFASYEPLASYEPEPLTSSMPDASMSSGPVCTSEMPPYLAAPGPPMPAPIAPASPRAATTRRRRRDPPARDRRRTRGAEDAREDTPEPVSGERIDSMHGELRGMLSARIDEARSVVDLGARHSEMSRRSVDEFGAVASGMRERSERAGSPDDAIEADDRTDEQRTDHSSEPEGEAGEAGADEADADSEGEGSEEGGEGGAEGGEEREEGAPEEEVTGTTSGGGGRAGTGGGATETAEREDKDKTVAIPRPDTEPAYLVEPPFENIPGSPQFGAALNFPEVATTSKDSLPSALADYRQRFTQATATARNLYDGIVAQAAMLAIQVRQEDNRRASRRVNDLAQAVREHDLNLAKAHLNLSLNVGHDLRQHDVNFRVAIRMIYGAAASGKARMAALASGFPQRLSAQHGQVGEINGKILTEITNGALAQTAAIAGLNRLVTNAASEFNGEHGGYYMSVAVNETLRGRIGSHVTDAVANITTECTSLQSGLANQATTLQPQMIKAFCQFTNWENLLRTEAPRQLDTAAAGSVRAARKMARKVRKQIIATGQKSEAAVVTQANQQRKQLVATACMRSARERSAAQAQDRRARAMTNALGTAPVQAVASIRSQIVKRLGAKEADIAGMAIGFADGLTRGVVPQITARKAQARALAQAGFGQLQADSIVGALSLRQLLANRSAAMDKSVQQSNVAGKEVVSGTRHELFKLAKPVTDSANGTIRSVNTGFDRAKGGLTDSLSRTSASVEGSLSGTPPPAAERTETPPVEVPCEGACCDANSPNSSHATEEPTELNMTPAMPEGPRAAFVRIGGYGTEPKTHPVIASFITGGINHVQTTIQDKSSVMVNHLSLLDSDPGTILPPLRGLTPSRAFALREFYGGGNIQKLPDDVEWYLNAGNAASGVTTRLENISAALNYLNGNAVAGARHELNAAVEWSNENQRIIDVMHSLTPAQMAQLNTEGGLSGVRGDLNASTGAVFDQLLRGDVNAGRATALVDAVNTARSSHNDTGVDNARDRIREAHRASGDTILQGKDLLGMETTREVDARSAARWTGALNAVAKMQGVTETDETRGDTLLNLASGNRDYVVLVSDGNDYGDHGGGSYHEETRTDIVRDSQRRATRLLIREGPDSANTLAAEMAVELERPGGVNQERMRTITRAVEVNPAVTPPGTRAYDEAVAKRNAFMTSVNEFSPTLPDNADGTPPTPEQLTIALGNRLAATAGTDTATGNYLRTLLVADPNNTANIVTQLNFAMDRAGTNMDALKHTLRGLTREQFDAVRQAYDDAHPGGPDLLTRIGIRGRGNFWDSDTSGGDAQDLEILSLGIPRTTQERAEISAMQMRQQIRDAGTVGSWLAGDAFSRLETGERNLMNMMGAHHMGFNADGDFVAYAADNSQVRLGNFDINGEYIPQTGRSEADLALAIAAGPQLAEGYKLATDRIANAITTTLIVAAAVISTVLTGGAAASIWIPMLVTFGAGVAGMIVNRAIKGARYGHEEMFQDFAVTLVQTLTAGAGAAIGLYARGGMTAVRAVASRAAMSEKLLERFLATKGVEMAGMGLARQVAVGAATGAIGGAGNAMLDGEAWRKGTWGTGILHGIARGALGGGVSAGAARPFARFMGSSNVSTRALARGISSGIGGAGSRGTEIFYDYNRGTYRGTLGDALGEMRDAGVQNAIQGVGEAYGEHIGDRGAMQGRGIAARFRGSDDRVIDIEDHYRTPAQRQAMEAAGEDGMLPVRPRITGEPSGAESSARRSVSPAGVDDDVISRPARPTPAGSEEIDGPTNRRGPADEDVLGPTRFPLAEGDAPLRIAPGPEDQLLLRSILPDDASIRATGNPPGRVLTPANDNGPAPVLRVALTAEAIVLMRPVGENTVVIHPDAKNLQAANDNYRMLIEADPSREVGIFRNPQTGEYVVVQGRTSAIKVPSGDITGAGAAPPRWISERHFHPNIAGESASGMIVRMPSGVGGDFTQIIKDLIALGNSPRQSSIDYMHEGKLIQTDFGVDPSSTTGRFWISFPDPVTGVRTRQNFASMSDYHAFVGQTLKITYDFPTGMGEPALRSIQGGSAEHPNALAPGSRATALSAEDHTAIRTLAAQADAIADMVPVMRQLALNGASERVVASMQDSLFAAIEHMVPTMRSMGLVQGADSMARLQMIVNQMDLPVVQRQAIIDAVMVANREAMIVGGTLQRNQAVIAMLHGAPRTRSASIRRDGIDLARLTKGSDDDFGRGFYLTQDLESAQLYRVNRSGGDPGEIFPFLMRMSDMANAIDVRPGGAHRAPWEEWLSRPAYPGSPMSKGDIYAMNPHQRGQGFDTFLRDSGLAAAHPGLILGDLGGMLTTGKILPNRITEQASMNNPAMIEAFNAQLGMRRTPVDTDDNVLRSIVDAEDSATPKPIAAEGETTLAKTAAAEDGPTSAGAAIPPPKGYANWHEVPDTVRARFEAAALASFTKAWGREGAELQVLVRLDEATVMRAMQAEDESVRTQAVHDFEAMLIANGETAAAARRMSQKLITLSNVAGVRYRHNLRHAVEVDIWGARLAAIPLELRPMARDSSLLLFLAANHPKVLTDLHARFISETVTPTSGPRTAAMFEDFVARTLKDHPHAMPGAEGRRILRFKNADAFNESSNDAAPLTRYEFGKLAYTTNEHGHVQRCGGVVQRVTGPRSSSALQTKIGNEGAATDVGFHLIAHIFGAEVNRLTVVPGHGKRIAGSSEPNLNGSAYKVQFENVVRNILDSTDQIVEVDIECVYNSGNHSNRPDVFRVRFRTDAGDWKVVSFPNKQ